MINFPFKNYAEFKDLFGIVEHGNGVKSRKNKILLAYFKSKDVFQYALRTGHKELLQVTDMAQLKTTVLNKIKAQGVIKGYTVRLINDFYGSDYYETDDLNGLCEDGNTKCVRYIKHEGEKKKPYKMRAGKFLKAIIEETEFGMILPEQVKIWLMEEFSMDFQTYALGKIPTNKLFVNKHFSRIYDSKSLEGNFDSCMVNRNYHSFYNDSVDASAAYLVNDEGMIIARCIIFNNVRDDDTGKIWRLAERQYSTGSNDILKRALVDSLIKGGYIDGYKRVGAGCRETNAFVDNEGRSLASCRFSIECTADVDSIYSFQDTFAYLSTGYGRAYNYEEADYDYHLDDTTGYVGSDEEDNDDDDDQNWDDWHEAYTYNDTVTVYCHGREYQCDEDRLEDFVHIEDDDEYHHKDDVAYCDKCGKPFVKADGFHSPITDETYCSSDCCEKEEDEYKKANWLWSSYDEEYYRDEDEIKTYYKWDASIGEYFERTIHVDSYDEAVETGEIQEFDGDGYDEIDPETQLPYNYKPTTEAINETLKEAV